MTSFIVPLAVLNTVVAVVVRDDHTHHHNPHAAPLLVLNETTHVPPSYYSIDFEDNDPSVNRYPGLMAGHILFMSLAFFMALPMGKLIDHDVSR